MQTSFARRGAIATVLLLGGCSGQLDAPSAYDDQEFWCEEDAAEARALRSAECRERASCAGWLSFRGTLQGQPVTVGSLVDVVELESVNAQGIGLVRDDVLMLASSPYFRLRWSFADFPPLAVTPGNIEYPVALTSGDGKIKSSLRLIGGAASVDMPARGGSLRTRWDASEQEGETELDFGSSDAIRGCFFARTALEATR